MATPVRKTSTPQKSGRATPKGTAPRKAKSRDAVYTHDDGDKFRLSGKINTFLLLKIQADQEDDEFNGADIYRLIIGMVTPDDRKRFITKLSRNEDFDVDNLNHVMTGMLEVVAGVHPTNSQSASGGTASRNTSRALSAAS